MASFCGFKVITCMALALILCVQSTLGGITCDHLDKNTCAFAVSSTGTRCVLEKHVRRGGKEEYTCRSSEIEAESLKDWIETDQCIKSCGLDRDTLGISSDALLDSHFTQQLCSSQCYQGCPNIVDLYFNLAAGEGVFLPTLCKATHEVNARREMAEIRSSGIPAPGPESGLPTSLNAYGPAVAAMAPL